MKVKLTGIKPHDSEIDEDRDGDYIEYYIDLLQQIPFPITVNADDDYPHTMNLKQYIKDKERPNDPQIWGLVWFDYEKI